MRDKYEFLFYNVNPKSSDNDSSIAEACDTSTALN